MRPFTLTLLVLIATNILVSCAHRADSLRLLEARAGYNDDLPDADIGLFEGGVGSQKSLVSRKFLKSARVYLHPTRLPSGDQFWGGYMTVSLGAERESNQDEFNDEIDIPERAAIKELPPPQAKKSSKTTKKVGK